MIIYLRSENITLVLPKWKVTFNPNPTSFPIDICYEVSTCDVRKGTFHWPEIVSGQQVDLRCPFSFTNPAYTTRACSVDSQGVGKWDDADFKSVCPDPPLAQLLDEIEYKVK